MAGQTLFRRVTKYVPSASADPGEDRLTEVTAGVLERVEGLARHLALCWLDPRRASPAETASASTVDAYRVLDGLPTSAAVTLRTQVPSEARRVDLELRFHEAGRTSPTAALLWVEVKHGITPHSGQLHDYLRLRPDYPGAVVLLAPRPDLPAAPEESPPAVPQRSWQATAAAAASFSPTTRSSVDRWLVHEWLAYLREEQLMDVEALGPEHFTALAYGGQARAAMEVVTQEAARVLIEARGEPIDYHRRHRKQAYGLGYWQTWHAAVPEGGGDWEGAWLDWKITESHGGDLGVPAGRVFVMAGLSKPVGQEFDSEWRGRLGAVVTASGERLKLRRWKGDHERLQRVRYPHEVLRGASLEEQGASLGHWVLETFTAIEGVGPPAGVLER